jgi:hypothetical protein
MKRLLLAAALGAGLLGGAVPAANACTIDTCPYTQPLCNHGVNCEGLAALVWCVTHHTGCPTPPPVR